MGKPTKRRKTPKKKPEPKPDVATILLSALADLIVGTALILIGKLLD